MRNIFLLALFVALALSGCGGGKTAAPVAQPAAPAGPQVMDWTYAPKALELTFISDPFLNEYGGAPHALSVCVYQLKSPDAFREMAATAPGMAKLLECASFGPDVVGVQRVKVRPGRNEVLTVDRGEKAKFVAVACGYYDPNQGSAVRVYEIPVSSNTSGWLWWKKTSFEPGKLAKKILLGKTGIQDAGDGS